MSSSGSVLISAGQDARDGIDENQIDGAARFNFAGDGALKAINVRRREEGNRFADKPEPLHVLCDAVLGLPRGDTVLRA